MGTALDEHKALWTLQRRTCDALCLQFHEDEPIHFDRSIPSSSNLSRIVARSLSSLGGVPLPSSPHGSEYVVEALVATLHGSSSFQPRVLQGIGASFYRYSRDDEMPLEHYLSSCENPTLTSDWVYGKGNVYEFRRGIREKVTSLVQEYWTSLELENFSLLGEQMRQEAKELYARKKQ